MNTFVSYTFDDHLINLQNRAEAQYLAKLEADSPALENAYIIVNPYFINPLAALIMFKTEKKEKVTMTIHGKRFERENIVKEFTENTSHIIPVIGLYEDFDTKVTITLSSGQSHTFTVNAEKLPEGTCHCRNIMTSLDYFGTDFMFLTPAGKNLPTAYDYAGDIRWMLTINTMFDIKRLKNGNILTGSDRYSRMPYMCTGLYEMTMLGKIVNEFRMPNNYHHDHWEMKDGNILALTQDYSNGSTTVEDCIALLDRTTGKVLRTWDFKNFLPQDVAGSGSQDSHDWFHCNALWVNEENKTFTLSGRHQDAIVNFSYDENDGKGRLNWIVGDPEGWPQEMVDKYFFTPVGDVENFDWQYEQHACLITNNGDVMAFDNGQYRSKNKENYLQNRDNFSRGVRYRINTEKMEIEQVWQYGKEFGQSFFSPYICNVEHYGGEHYLIHSGGVGSLDGYATDKLPQFVFRTRDPKDPQYFLMSSKTVEQKDGVVMYYMETEGNFYRAERLNAYHNGDNLCLKEGKILGELDITETFDTIPDVEEVMQLVPLQVELKVLEEVDKIMMTASFERGSMVMYVLESKDEARAYYINTAAVKYNAMCSGVFLEKKAETQKFNISKLGLSGAYTLKVIIDDKKYQTGITIYC